MEKRTISLTLEEAQELYAKKESVSLLLTVFTKEELTPPPVKSWEDLKEIKGYFINSFSNVNLLTDDKIVNGKVVIEPTDKNVFATEELAYASLAIAQLSQLIRQPYFNGNYSFNWLDSSKKWCVFFTGRVLNIDAFENLQHFLAFPTKEKAAEFVNLYRDLIEQAKPLL